MTSPPSASEIEAPNSTCPFLVMLASQESVLSAHESAAPVDLSLRTNDVVDLTQSSESSSSSSTGVDAIGIPLDVYHYRQQNTRHDVWDVAHRLTTPYTKASGQDMEAYTHIRLLCAQQLTCSPFAAANAWENALHRWSNTSSVRAHMIALHEDNPVGKNNKGMVLKVAAQHVDAAMAHAHAH